MLLITSGEYVETELFSEFGQIPPAFLPVGNKRLYSYQISQFEQYYDTIWLTIPADFELDEVDALYLEKHRVHLFRTGVGVSLACAVRSFLRATLDQCQSCEPIDILYGDTLIGERFHGTDWLAVGDSDENYHWHHEVARNGQPGGTWTGMFSFSDPRLLYERLDASDDFITGVTAYGDAIGQLEHKVTRKWMDFGHIHTYFDSKREITTQCHFNQLCIADGVLTKSSSDTQKILAEAAWFEQAPPAVRPFLPNYIVRNDSDPAGYALEYLHLAALNELYVFGRLPPRVWKKIFSACDAFLQATSRVTLPEPGAGRLFPHHLSCQDARATACVLPPDRRVTRHAMALQRGRNALIAGHGRGSGGHRPAASGRRVLHPWRFLLQQYSFRFSCWEGQGHRSARNRRRRPSDAVWRHAV